MSIVRSLFIFWAQTLSTQRSFSFENSFYQIEFHIDIWWEVGVEKVYISFLPSSYSSSSLVENFQPTKLSDSSENLLPTYHCLHLLYQQWYFYMNFYTNLWPLSFARFASPQKNYFKKLEPFQKFLSHFFQNLFNTFSCPLAALSIGDLVTPYLPPYLLHIRLSLISIMGVMLQ